MNHDSKKSGSTERRDQVVKLVREVQAAAGCRMDLDGMLNKLESLSNCPEIGQLIFCPPDGKALSAEEIADRALKN